MSDDHDFPPTKDHRHNIHSSGWTTTESEFTSTPASRFIKSKERTRSIDLSHQVTIHEAWRWANFEAAKTGTLKRIIWRRENDGIGGCYEAELDAPIGIIKLSCTDVSFAQEDKMKKWFWKVEWPGGEVAEGGHAHAFFRPKSMRDSRQMLRAVRRWLPQEGRVCLTVGSVSKPSSDQNSLAEAVMSDEEIEVPVFFQRRGELYRGMAQFHAKRCHIALTGRQLKTGGWDYAGFCLQGNGGRQVRHSPRSTGGIEEWPSDSG